MKHGKMHKWILPLALGMSLLLSVTVFAQQSGSLLLKNIQHSVALYPVADGEDRLNAAFQNAQVDLSDPTKAVENARQLEKYVLENHIAGEIKTPDTAQQVLYSNLEKGCYLVCSQADPSDFAPFLVWIPTTLGQESIYDVQADPKTEDPADPEDATQPTTPEPNIPQTGIVQWPKYALLALGGAAILFGGAEMIRGGRKNDEQAH